MLDFQDNKSTLSSKIYTEQIVVSRTELHGSATITFVHFYKYLASQVDGNEQRLALYKTPNA